MTPASECGRTASGDSDLCDECAFKRQRSDAMEASGRSLEPSCARIGGAIGLVSEATDYRKGEEEC
jgi:hypothetical protein